MESRLIRSWGDYFYPGTTVLRNRFGETDAERLRQKEDFATHVRLAELASQPIRGEFDWSRFHNQATGRIDRLVAVLDHAITPTDQTARLHRGTLRRTLDP